MRLHLRAGLSCAYLPGPGSNSRFLHPQCLPHSGCTSSPSFHCPPPPRMTTS